MATLSRNVARSVGAVLFLGLAMVHFLALPHAFHLDAYIGVIQIIATGMALAGTVGLLADDRDRIWWYSLAEGALNALGYLVTRFTGLPPGGHDIAGGWLREPALALAFLGVLLAALAIWVLVNRHRGALPVTAAKERDAEDAG